MNQSKFFFIFHIVLLFSFNSLADFPRADFATFWGGFNRITKCSLYKGKIKKIKIPSIDKETKIYLSIQNKPSPLFIIYPGVFGEVDHKMVFHMAAELEKLGVHVIALPNIASASYLGIRKEARTNPWSEEQAAQKEMLISALKEIEPRLITSFNILAESLGIWQAVMLLEVSPLPIKNMVLMWPPLNLGESLNRFDVILKDSKATYDSCTFWWKWPYVLFKYKRDHIPENISAQDELCYGSYILRESFVKGIRNVTKKTYKMREMKLENGPETFNSFVDYVMKDLGLLLHDKNNFLRFETWLPYFKKLNLSPIIYTSADDFLNQESDWNTIKDDLFFQSNLTIYPWGGHSGRAAEPEFWDNLRLRVSSKI